jgi:hypothetical protein
MPKLTLCLSFRDTTVDGASERKTGTGILRNNLLRPAIAGLIPDVIFVKPKTIKFRRTKCGSHFSIMLIGARA